MAFKPDTNAAINFNKRQKVLQTCRCGNTAQTLNTAQTKFGCKYFW